MPRGRRPGVSVQQDHWRAAASVAHTDRRLSDPDLIGGEPLEHVLGLRRRSVSALKSGFR
jgi:hypothetical protein